MNYVFRLRLRMMTPMTLDGAATTMELAGFPLIEVTHEARPSSACRADPTLDCPISKIARRGGERFVFICRGYASDDEARVAGRRLADALLVSGALGFLGIDIGFDRATLQFSEHVHAAMREDTGRELRGEMFGLMTYLDDSISIVGMNGELFATTSSASVQQHLSRWLDAAAPTLGLRQRRCASLLNDSFYATTSESQFILRVAAMEALCEQVTDPQFVSVIDGLVAHLTFIEGTEEAKMSARLVLLQAKRKSVRQAYMSKLRMRLGDAKARAFDALYTMRSAFVHDGEGRGDMQGPAAEALQLATELLESELTAGAT